jgi:hypothetical protein
MELGLLSYLDPPTSASGEWGKRITGARIYVAHVRGTRDEQGYYLGSIEIKF